MNRRHAFWMLVCCLIPAAGIAALVVFRVPLNTALWLVLALACPLIHVLGMRSMDHDPGSHRSSAPSSPALAPPEISEPSASGTEARPG
ncbi:MAG: DUF2933 domain-containing protein [Anaerolineales bacterium]